MRRPPDFETMRAALWTLRALRSVRFDLARGRLRGLVIPPPPALSQAAVRGVNGVLRRYPSTCLERSLVLQRWHASHGRPRDVVIGVTTPREFGAHAWLDGEHEADSRFVELSRIQLVDPA